MGFGRAHKVTTYLSVWCSYLALALSGELSDPAVLMALIGIVASWWWEPPRVRVERWAKLWSGAGILVLVYSIFAALSGDDLVLVGGELLLFLTVAKLFGRRAAKDYQQVYVLSFLMMVAATVVNSEVSFGIFFLGYVIASTWALILLHLRREIEDSLVLNPSGPEQESPRMKRVMASKRIVGPRFFIGTGAVSIIVFAGAALLFLAIPRIGFGLFFNKGRGGVHLTGFSDGVRLGGHGVIKDDDTVVMRVEVSGGYGGRDAPYLHWRGVAFDKYHKGQWSRSDDAPITLKRIEVDQPFVTHHLLYDRAATDADLEKRTVEAIRQDIYLDPLGYDVLFGASMPTAFRIQPNFKARPRLERNDEIRYPHSSGIKYTVFSAPERIPDKNQRTARPGPLPEGYGVYLQVPPEITDGVRSKALELTAGLTSNYDKAVAVRDWLQSELSYTLDMKSPRGREPIDFFLFERKMGHCEYFSSAMAIMLRVAGVPTRNVNGFLGGEWNEYLDYIAVRAGDAHSWVEVYTGDAGWMTFDPTPSATIDRLGRGGLGILDRLRRLTDTLRFQWFKWIIEYDLESQLRGLRRIANFFKGSAGKVFGLRWQGMRAWARRNKTKTAAILLAIAALLAGIVLWQRRRRGLDSNRALGPRSKRHPIALLYIRAHRSLAKRGFARPESDTPKEHAQNLRADGAPGAEPLEQLIDLYYAAEYGGQSDGANRDRAHRLAREVEAQVRQHRRPRRQRP